MIQCIRNLGFKVDSNEEAKTVSIVGGKGKLPRATSFSSLLVGNAGTAARFLPCLVALGNEGEYRFDSDKKMYERPMQELLTVLQDQGAKVHFAILPGQDSSGTSQQPAKLSKGYPFSLLPKGISGGLVSIDITKSTQFASGLLMAAPYARTPLEITVTGSRDQIPYVDMTAAMMGQFGVTVSVDRGVWRVPLGSYKSPGTYVIEPDVSGAAYFYAAGALIGGKVVVKGLETNSMQGDIRLLEVMKNHWGCKFFMDDPGLVMVREPDAKLKGLDIDMNAFSDQALTLAALAPFCDGPTNIRNVAHIRKQECDRIHAIAKNLATLGIHTEEREDGIKIFPGQPNGGVIETFGDHRVAMAFSLVGLKVPGIIIDNRECVAKTFENYWDTFKSFQGLHV